MKPRIFVIAVALMYNAGSVNAQEIEYRFDQEKNGCFDKDGNRGFNEGHLGECGRIEDKDLKGLTLTDVHFLGASLSSVDFSDSVFENVSFRHATVSDTSFRSVKWTSGLVMSSQFYKCDFRKSELSGRVLDAYLYETLFSELTLRKLAVVRSEFSASVLKKITAEVGTSLSEVTLTKTTLSDSEFNGTEGEEIRISQLTMREGSVFSGNKLNNVSFQSNALGQSITRNVFESSRVSGQFAGSSWVETQFSDCDIGTFTDFTRADLSSVVFDERTMERMKGTFYQALYDDDTVPFAADFPLAVKMGLYKRPY